jgi:PKD repeat protein
VAKTSVFLPAGQQCLWGISNGPASGYPYPDAAMTWGTQAVGWAVGDLAKFNKQKALLGGAAPQMVRVSTTTPTASTGVSGSAGPYGLFTPDWRSIANTGAGLVIAVKYNTVSWAQIATDLNSATTNATRVDFDQMVVNLKHWYDDTGNTVPVARRKVILAFHDEPSGKAVAAGFAATDYVNAHRAVYNYLRSAGVSDGPKPSSGPGSAYTGTWYDMVEWAWIDTAFSMRTGTSAYYPGDAYVRWALVTGYNYGGGQGDTTSAKSIGGQVPQPGDVVTPTGRYVDPWNNVSILGNNGLVFYKNGPIVAGVQQPRDVLFGFGSIGSAEDLDRFTVGATGTLALPKVHTGQPHKKGQWITGLPRYLRGLAYAPGDADNAFAANPDAVAYRMALYNAGINLQVPVEFNTIPFQPGDTTAPTSTGTERTYTLDQFTAAFADAVFTPPAVGGGGGGGMVVGPSGVDFTTTVHQGDSLSIDVSAVATAGSSALVSWLFNFGDGQPAQVISSAATAQTLSHTYAAAGTYPITVTVTDSSDMQAAKTRSVLIQASAVGAATTPLAAAPYIVAGDTPVDFRGTFNAALDALENYADLRGDTADARAVTADYTLAAADAGLVIDANSASTVVVTVPANAGIAVGAVIEVCRVGSGALTVTPAAGVTFLPTGSVTARAQGSSVYLRQRGTNSWIVSGDVT